MTLLSFLLLLRALRRASQNKNWVPEHSVPAKIEIRENGRVNIYNLVKAEYKDALTAKVDHEILSFKLEDLDKLYFLIELFEVKTPFGTIEPAHAFLTFELKDGYCFSISVAGRRKLGERVNFKRIIPLKNEIIYKIIREKDTLIGRVCYEKDTVYRYRLKLSKKQVKDIFVSMANTVNRLHDKAEWFDTFTRNCTTEIMKHLRQAGINVPIWNIRYVLTMGIDKLLLKNNLLKTGNKNMNLSEIRERYKINSQVRRYAKNTLNEFCKRLRKIYT